LEEALVVNAELELAPNSLFGGGFERVAVNKIHNALKRFKLRSYGGVKGLFLKLLSVARKAFVKFASQAAQGTELFTFSACLAALGKDMFQDFRAFTLGSVSLIFLSFTFATRVATFRRRAGRFLWQKAPEAPREEDVDYTPGLRLCGQLPGGCS